jgi:signal peptidase I
MGSALTGGLGYIRRPGANSNAHNFRTDHFSDQSLSDEIVNRQITSIAYPMSKPAKSAVKPREAGSKQTATASQPAEAPASHAVRETVESIVIAFVLAFLFRTFEAEAFVIPTGSMAPTLMGRHKDVECLKCGHRFRVTASEEGDEAESLRARIRGIQQEMKAPNRSSAEIMGMRNEIEQLSREIDGLEIVSGVCPVCRYPMPMSPSVPNAGASGAGQIEKQRTFNGDRILVNKYLFTIDDPQRWEVVVFHFPGDAEVNYIKRLVGLPGETLRIFQGDLLVGAVGATAEEDFTITRKPPEKVLAVRQLVHDTDYDPAELYAAGWPLRWRATSPTGADGWQTDSQIEGATVRQRYSVDRTHGGEAWLRYRHMTPSGREWRELAALQQAATPEKPAKFSEADHNQWRPELIMDFNAYNTRVKRSESQNGLWPDEFKLGMHWVGDLMLEADVEVAEAKGELLLDLVEAGKHFTARIDLATGRATLGIEGLADYAPTADTRLSAAGNYHVAFANVDDQLLLWIDGKLIQFDKDTAYDVVAVFGERHLRPQTSGPNRADLDLAPAGIGARGSKLAVTRLQVWRDIYYIADSWPRRQQDGGPISDYDRPTQGWIKQMRSDPSMWDEFLRRRHVDFPLADDQYFVMGDNSPESSDARLWREMRLRSDGTPAGQPGGAYLERKLLIGKAVCVYWPHAWYTLPFTGKRVPVWPNFKDMRLVR